MFNLNVTVESSETCDKCKKAASMELPIVQLQITGRSWNDRQFIQIHERCLEKAIKVSKAGWEETEHAIGTAKHYEQKNKEFYHD